MFVYKKKQNRNFFCQTPVLPLNEYRVEVFPWENRYFKVLQYFLGRLFNKSVIVFLIHLTNIPRRYCGRRKESALEQIYNREFSSGKGGKPRDPNLEMWSGVLLSLFHALAPTCPRNIFKEGVGPFESCRRGGICFVAAHLFGRF